MKHKCDNRIIYRRVWRALHFVIISSGNRLFYPGTVLQLLGEEGGLGAKKEQQAFLCEALTFWRRIFFFKF
jgi:hypothetical protein